MYTSKLISLVKTIENKINYLSLQKKHLPEPEFKKLKYTLSLQKDEYCNYYKTYYDIFQFCKQPLLDILYLQLVHDRQKFCCIY